MTRPDDEPRAPADGGPKDRQAAFGGPVPPPEEADRTEGAAPPDPEFGAAPLPPVFMDAPSWPQAPPVPPAPSVHEPSPFDPRPFPLPSHAPWAPQPWSVPPAPPVVPQEDTPVRSVPPVPGPYATPSPPPAPAAVPAHAPTVPPRQVYGCPLCLAPCPSLGQRLLGRKGRHRPGCPAEVLSVRLLVGLTPVEVTELVEDFRARNRGGEGRQDSR